MSSNNQKRLKQARLEQNLLRQAKLNRVNGGVIIAGLLFITLVVRMQVMSFISPVLIGGALNTGLSGDFFVYYKTVGLYFLTGAVLITLLYRMLVFHYNIPASAVDLPVLLLAVLILIGVSAADYYTVALFGAPDLYMGAVSWLCLLIIFFASSQWPYGTRFFNGLNIALCVITAVNGLITIGQFYGISWHLTPGFQSLLVPGDYPVEAMKGQLMSTLSNPNYASGLFGAMAALFLGLAAWHRRPAWQVINGLFCVLALCVVLAARSTSGFICFLGILPLAGAALAFKDEGRIRAALVMLVILAGSLGVGAVMMQHDTSIQRETYGWVERLFASIGSDKNPNPGAEPANPAQPVPAASDDKFTLPSLVHGADQGRLYIAGQSLLILNRRPLTGYGLDTLAFYFPLNSRAYMTYVGENQILTKPHDMYVQLAFGAGYPALICFLWIVGLCGWRMVKYVRTHRASPWGVPPFMAAIPLFMAAYLIQGLVNDMALGAGLVFWVLMGVGYAVTRSAPARPPAAPGTTK